MNLTAVHADILAHKMRLFEERQILQRALANGENAKVARLQRAIQQREKEIRKLESLTFSPQVYHTA